MKLNKKQFSQYLCYWENPNVITLAQTLLKKLLFEDKTITAKDFHFIEPEQEGKLFIPGKITISKNRLIKLVCDAGESLPADKNLEIIFPFLKKLPDYPQTLELIILNEKEFATEAQVEIAMREAYHHGVTENVLRYVISHGKDYPDKNGWWFPMALMETFVQRGGKLELPEPLIDGDYLAPFSYDKVFAIEKLAIQNNIFQTANPEKDFLSFGFSAYKENKADEALDVFELEALFPETSLKICTHLLEIDNLNTMTILRILNWIDNATTFCGPNCDQCFFEKLITLKHIYPGKILKIAQQLARNTSVLHAPLCKFIIDEYPGYISELLKGCWKDVQTNAIDLVSIYSSVENKKDYLKFLRKAGLDKLLQKQRKKRQAQNKFFKDFGVL